MSADAGRSQTMRQISEEFIAAHPDPSDPVAHTLSVYADEPDEAFVIVASGNVYGHGVKTGLTWGDLRRLSAAASEPSNACARCKGDGTSASGFSTCPACGGTGDDAKSRT